MKIEEWPSRAKWDQAGQNRVKWCQTGSNGAKLSQTDAKRANGAKRGQIESCGADFLHARIFL